MSRKFLATPYMLWIACGTVIPLLVIAYYGFTDRSGVFTFANIKAIFGADHAQALGLSLLLAFISTVICFLLAYPLAMNRWDRSSAVRVGSSSSVIFTAYLGK